MLGHSRVVFGLKNVIRLIKRIVFGLTLNGLAGQVGRLDPDPIPTPYKPLEQPLSTTENASYHRNHQDTTEHQTT